jgi:hypothetical protein
MNNQNIAMEMNKANFNICRILVDYDADKFDEAKFAATPYRFTKFNRILLPVYQHALKASASTGLYIADATDEVPSLMGDKFKDISDFWEVQRAFLKVYLTGLSKLVNMDRNHLSKIFAKMSDSDFGFMLVAFEKARHHFFFFDEPSCLIEEDVEDAFALLSDHALELIYKFTTEM